MQNAERRVYIEFGAGKGYLSSMLADASDARQFVLLDMRGFRMKADRYFGSNMHLCPVTCVEVMLCVSNWLLAQLHSCAHELARLVTFHYLHCA